MRTPRNTSVSLYIAVIAASGVTLLSMLTAANAGPGDGPKGGMKPGGNHKGMGKMASGMELTEAQKSKMMSLQADAMKQRKAIEANTALTPDQKKTQMRSLMMSTLEKFKGTLTPEQRKMMETQMAERRAQMKAMRTKKGAAPVAPK